MKKGFLFLSILFLSVNAHAGAWAVTVHSRANCAGFNESITWHAGHSYYWRVESHHFPYGWSHPAHIVNTGKQYTWRAAAYHLNEAYANRGDKWFVRGYHFYYVDGRQIFDQVTEANDCNIYDGWWD